MSIDLSAHPLHSKPLLEQRAGKIHQTMVEEISLLRKQLSEERALRKILEADLARVKFALIPEKDIVSMSWPYRATSGVYFLIHDDRVVYVGQSIKAHTRLEAHFDDAKKAFDRVAIIPAPAEALNDLEAAYIRFLRPKYNKTLAGDPPAPSAPEEQEG